MSRILFVTAMMVGSAALYGQAPAPSVQSQITTQKKATADSKPAAAPAAPPKVDLAALKKRAEAGDAAAADQLADAYSMGVLGYRDLSEASKWYRKAAENGSVKAQVKIGMLLEGGFGVARDPKQAMAWYEKAAAHDETDAMMRLANAYMNGIETDTSSVEKNPAVGLKWLAKAAQLGVSTAQIEMGEACVNGIPDVLQPNYAEAMKWYRMAADQNDPTGLYEVGKLYEEGKGVPASSTEAKAWYQKALQKGSPEARSALRRLQY